MVKKVEFRHIVRLASTELKGKTPIRLALTKIKGIGPATANTVVKVMKLDPKKQVGNFEDKELSDLEEYLKKMEGIPVWARNIKFDPRTGTSDHVIASDLLIRQKNDIDYMKKSKTYRGMRHAFGLRVRGQRTKSTGRRSGKALGVHRKKMIPATKGDKK